jgi:nitroreductase
VDTLSLLKGRQSLRVYDDRPVPEDVRRAVLEAAASAPTAGALMLYAMIEIGDQSIKDALSHTCDEQPFIAKAPWLLLFAADYQRLYDSWPDSGKKPKREPGAGDLMLAMCDALIAAQTAVIAAEALGLGSCYIGDIIENMEKHQALLDLPRFTFPAALLCFGYPSQRDNRKRVPRLPLEAVVHKDKYQKKDWLNSDWAKKLSDRGLAKFESDFSIEMTRSVRAWLDRWQGAAHG